MTTDLITTTGQALAPVDLVDMLDQEIDRDPRLKSKHTKRGYRASLAEFETWKAGRPMTRRLVEQYAAELQARDLAPRTINFKLAAIRWSARRLAEIAQDQPVTNEHERLLRAEMVTQAERAASVPDVSGTRSKAGRHINQGELDALMAACQNDPTPAGARDAAMIAIAWQTAARRDEIAGLDLADFNPTGPEEGELLIRGKGDKERTAYLYDGAAAALADWLAIRGQEPGPIFCAINKSGKLTAGQRMIGNALRLILEKRRHEARLKPLTWHDFRRTFAGNLLDHGTDLPTVQKLMGHASPTTTSNYDRRSDEVKRQAVKTLFVPYRRRMV